MTNSEDLNAIGAEIRRRREGLGLSQPQLAARMGTANNAGYISQVENGKRDIGLSRLYKFAAALECKPTDILDSQLVPYENSITASVLESAGAEHQILVAMTLEDTFLEMQPLALERLAERVRIEGKTNQYGHKQLRSIVLKAGQLLEVSDDGAEAVSEARAAELL